MSENKLHQFTLEDLREISITSAKDYLKEHGSVQPRFTFLTPNNNLSFFPFIGEFSEENRQKFSDLARTIAIVIKAKAVVFMTECWVAFAPKSEAKDLIPSEHPDRKEGVMITMETRESWKQEFFPIVRDGNGNFFNLLDSDPAYSFDSKKGSRSGRFTHILGPENVPEEIQMLAKIFLEIEGVKIEAFLVEPEQS